MGRKPASEQGDTLEEIQSVSFALFGRHGYDGVSISRIAREAGITKAAIYWHYADKQALYVDCLARLYALFDEIVLGGVAREELPEHKLVALFEGAHRLVQDERVSGGVAGYWLETKTVELSEARRIQDTFEQGARDRLACAIDEAIARGAFRRTLGSDTIAGAVIAIMEAIVLPLRRQGARASGELLLTLAYTFFHAHASEECAARCMQRLRHALRA